MPKVRQTAVKNEAEVFAKLGAMLKNSVINPDISGYVPHPKQTEFHKSKAKQRLYIGGNRAGKTVAGACEAIYYLRGQHPHKKIPDKKIYGRIVGVDFPQGVDKIILPMLQRWMPPSLLINGSWDDSYSSSERLLTCSNGNQTEFLSYDQILQKFAGTSRDFVWNDEEPPEDIYQECLMRTLDVKGDYWFTLTPVDGMTWIYDSLYLPGKNTTNPHIDAIEVLTTDNPHIDVDEIETIKSAYSEDDLKARLEGRFVQRAGLIYPNFSLKNNVISAHIFKPNHKNKLIASLDHGFSNATAWLWGEVDAMGNVIVYDEYYKSSEIVSTHAEVIHKINFDHGKIPDYYIGDPSIRNTEPLQGKSVQSEYSVNGISIALGNNNLKTGYQVVNNYVNGVNNKKLYITDNCVNLIEQMSKLHWATYQSKRISKIHNAKEEQHKKDDHACDSLRYMLMSLFDETNLNKTAINVYEDVFYSNAVDIDQPVAKYPKPKKFILYDEYTGEV